MSKLISKEMKKIVKNGYDLGKYAKYFGNKKELNLFEKRYFNQLIECIPEKSNILDLGCGTGLPYDAYLVEHGHNITGIDNVDNHIKLAKKNVKEGNYILADFTKYKFKKNSFNAIIMMYSIFHILRKEHECIIKFINEYLVNNGFMLIVMCVQEADEVEIDYNFCGNVKMAWSSYNSEKNIELIETNGFEIIQYDNESDYSSEEDFLWILAKKK